MGEAAAFVSAGGAGMLVAVIVYLLNANRLDRKQYEDAIDRAEQRADAAEQRTRDVRAVAEEARQARYAAEEAASVLRAQLAALRRNEHQP